MVLESPTSPWVLWQKKCRNHEVVRELYYADSDTDRSSTNGTVVAVQTRSGWYLMRAVACGSLWLITTRQTWRRPETSATRRERVAWHRKPWRCQRLCRCQQAAACLSVVMKNDLTSWRYSTLSTTTTATDIVLFCFNQPASLALWRPLLPYGYSHKTSCARLG